VLAKFYFRRPCGPVVEDACREFKLSRRPLLLVKFRPTFLLTLYSVVQLVCIALRQENFTARGQYASKKVHVGPNTAFSLEYWGGGETVSQRSL